jgi:putative transposase
MSADHCLTTLCLALQVSRSGYYAWVERQPGPRAQANATLLPLITQADQESRHTYGSPCVTRWLQAHGYRCGRHRVARLMRGAGLRGRARRRFRVCLTDSDHDLPIAANRLLGRCQPARPDAVWVADITYVPTAEGWLYVAGVLDRWSRRCVGWAMS